jgi:hypothetical protein
LSERFLADWAVGGRVAVSRSSLSHSLFQPQLPENRSFICVVTLHMPLGSTRLVGMFST